MKKSIISVALALISVACALGQHAPQQKPIGVPLILGQNYTVTLHPVMGAISRVTIVLDTIHVVEIDNGSSVFVMVAEIPQGYAEMKGTVYKEIHTKHNKSMNTARETFNCSSIYSLAE